MVGAGAILEQLVCGHADDIAAAACLVSTARTLSSNTQRADWNVGSRRGILKWVRSYAHLDSVVVLAVQASVSPHSWTPGERSIESSQALGRADTYIVAERDCVAL